MSSETTIRLPYAQNAQEQEDRLRIHLNYRHSYHLFEVRVDFDSEEGHHVILPSRHIVSHMLNSRVIQTFIIPARTRQEAMDYAATLFESNARVTDASLVPDDHVENPASGYVLDRFRLWKHTLGTPEFARLVGIPPNG